ncbi:MAG: hypothetical protein Q4D26_10445 [Clostridia bacterium]|nr:hypothetical protein [Clostridia bacterium]
MKKIIMTEGRHIDYKVEENCIIFGDDDLMLNLKNREMNEKVVIDICTDINGFLVVGTASGNRYAAQIEIPARIYTDEQAVPFNIDNCTISLWGLEE